MTRQTEPGPKPGTYIITVEIPDIDVKNKAVMQRLDDLYVTFRVLASAYFNETWTTTHRVMPDRGKHGGPINPDT